MMRTGILLIRHPEPQVAPGICYGRLDLTLSEEGEKQLRKVLTRIPPVRAVIASPARRCEDLAQSLATRDRHPLTLDERLQELSFGDWEGRPWDEIERAESDPWAADPWAIAPPGGETFARLHARVTAALRDAPPGSAIITHAGPIRAAQMILLGKSFREVFTAPVPYAEPIRIDTGG